MLISESEVGFLADMSVMADFGWSELNHLYQNRQHCVRGQKRMINMLELVVLRKGSIAINICRMTPLKMLEAVKQQAIQR